jgi:hypothetical protein
MRKILLLSSLILIIFLDTLKAQTLMPLPSHNSVYSTYIRGYWFIAPCNFRITGLRVPIDAGTGLQYIHVMKCRDPFAIATTGSTNFVTLAYISGATSNVIQQVNINIQQGDTIGIMGSAGTGNSYTASAIHTSNINGLPVNLTRLGYQGNINTGPAPNYWGTAATTAGSISRIEMYYTTSSPAPNNASVAAFVSPNSFCAGTHDVKVKIKNTGSTTLNSVYVNWTVDGVAQTPIYWTSPLDTVGGTSYNNDTIITIGSQSFSSGISKAIKVWTSLPNSVNDTVNDDDTVTVQLKPSLNGNFTIGGTTPDYATVADAVSDLNNYGVCGPVTFNIRNGIYTGNYSLGNIAGSSSINTILFQSESGNMNNVTLSNNSGSTSNYILKLNSTKFVSFKNISFTALNSTYANVIEFAGSASFNVIDSCKLTSATATASNTGIVCVFADDLLGGNNTIKNCQLLNGSYGVYWYGTSTSSLTDHNVFENNTITNAYYYSMHFYYNSNLKVRGNTITTNTAYTSHVGLRTYYSDGEQEITNNYISVPALYGMYLYYNDATISAPSIIANNEIIVGGTGAANGIRSYYSSNQKFYNNSIRINSTSASSYAGYFYYSSASYVNNTIRNNIFSNMGGGPACYIYNATAATGNTFDYNNYYKTTHATLIQEASPTSAAHQSLNAWKNSTNQDKNSVSFYPSFMGATDLRPNTNDSLSWALNGLGIQISGFNEDRQGNFRSSNFVNGAPDLGAYEFTPNVMPSRATVIPATPVAGGTQSFVYGSDTIAKITWDITSTAPTSIEARLFQGVYPAGIDSTIHSALNAYWWFNTPAGSYNYEVKLYYRNAWIGSNSSETDMIGALKLGTNPWAGTSNNSLDTNLNTITISSLTDIGEFTGTSVGNPLPVKLGAFNAMLLEKDVRLNWITHTEINSKQFEIEFSLDGKNFKQIGAVRSSGNSKTTKSYEFIHLQAASYLESSPTIYYRLKMVDRDGTYEYSKIINVNTNKELEIILVPNPFNDALFIQYNNINEGEANVAMFDISGKQILHEKLWLKAGLNKIGLPTDKNIESGIYFMKITQQGESRLVKLIKY